MYDLTLKRHLLVTNYTETEYWCVLWAKNGSNEHLLWIQLFLVLLHLKVRKFVVDIKKKWYLSKASQFLPLCKSIDFLHILWCFHKDDNFSRQRDCWDFKLEVSLIHLASLRKKAWTNQLPFSSLLTNEQHEAGSRELTREAAEHWGQTCCWSQKPPSRSPSWRSPRPV